MSRNYASDLASRLAQNAEAVCRHYLPEGRRSGNYWLIGDVLGTPGRSMYVRLNGPTRGKGAAEKWADAASGEYGDLLDIIAATCGLSEFRDVAEEARQFLGLPDVEPSGSPQALETTRRSRGSLSSARRLFAMSKPISGTLAETYLSGRGIKHVTSIPALRVHPACFYRPEEGAKVLRLPAMIASVTDLSGTQTGAHRTWLALDGSGKAPVATPRRALGELLGCGVRFGMPEDVLAAGEGIETVLSVRMALPGLPAVAALSAAHLAALKLPDGLRRLYILCDRDPAGASATETLTRRATEAGIEPRVLLPQLGDFNDDLRRLGLDALRERLVGQLHPEDAAHFLEE